MSGKIKSFVVTGVASNSVKHMKTITAIDIITSRNCNILRKCEVTEEVLYIQMNVNYARVCCGPDRRRWAGSAKQ